MIKYYTEVTNWDYRNHTYLIDNDVSRSKILGYIKEGESDIIMFKSPIYFSKARRKFKISSKPPEGAKIPETELAWSEFDYMLEKI